jgi:hypothetical protein
VLHYWRFVQDLIGIGREVTVMAASPLISGGAIPGIAQTEPLVSISSALQKPSIGPSFQMGRDSAALASRSRAPANSVIGRSFNVATSAGSPSAVSRDASGNLVGSGIIVDSSG